MRHPPPFVALTRLSGVAQEFELKAHTINVADAHFIASDLRIAITRAFSKKQLTIPASFEILKTQ